MGNCLLSDTNTLDMNDLTDLVPTAAAATGGTPGMEWDVFNMRPGGSGCGGGGGDGGGQLVASGSGVVSARAGK